MPKKTTEPSDQVADAAVDTTADASTEPAPHPAAGGVYRRQPDGGLQAVDGPAAQVTQE